MHRQILLTGATGALGPQLAAELLAASAASRLALVIRPGPAQADVSPRQRFDSWLKVVRSLLPADDAPALLARIHPVVGDISHDNLGLDPAENARLLAETDLIIHAAADTRFSAPPAAQWAVNVDGTRHMLQWAARCARLRQFILVSSTYVAGSNTGLITETIPTHRPHFVTHYQRTKWEAEQLALASGLPMAMARISLIMGSHATGFIHRTGAMHSLIRWFSRGLVPMLPGLPSSTADLIATETAAQCLAKAASIDHSSFLTHHSSAIWHIAAGHHAPSLAELVDFVFDQFAIQPAWRRKGIAKPPIVEQAEFDRFVESADSSAHPALAEALRSINSFMPDLLYPKTYDTTRAQAMWGGRLPLPDWRSTLQKVIHFIARRRTSCQPQNPAFADAS